MKNLFKRKVNAVEKNVEEMMYAVRFHALGFPFGSVVAIFAEKAQAQAYADEWDAKETTRMMGAFYTIEKCAY